MRKFSSYGPVNRNLHYYVPRQALVDSAHQQLTGNDPAEGGHYITVWASRQTGKSWVMREVYQTLLRDSRFHSLILPVQDLEQVADLTQVIQTIGKYLIEKLALQVRPINDLQDFAALFRRDSLSKPLILILDEFDGLAEPVLAKLVGFFRNIYHSRQNQVEKPSHEKDYLLHGLALIGVRNVLGLENPKGSPFNVQRSIHIPNLTRQEVGELFAWYQRESGQCIEPEVVEGIWYEFQGQPGLTCWFGEILTETYNKTPEQPITLDYFRRVYAAACYSLPNSNVINLVSKARQEAYRPFVLEFFQTKTKVRFRYDDPVINFLYMNGVIDEDKPDEEKPDESYVKFPSPYVQKRLFSYFARELYAEPQRLYDPFEDISDTVTDDSLNIRRLLQRYEQYLHANRARVLADAPRRKDDLRVFEAVFHFHLYLYLSAFLRDYDDARVQPEFPTGNGQIDLLIRHAGQLYGLELKSFSSRHAYHKALSQAAAYARQLGLTEIWLGLFVEVVDDTNRRRFEADYTDPDSGVTVHPVFVQTGKDEE